ncbi:MAG: hypothetical protein GXY55_13770 [Phycisphaerae bacterium]|nr:hypothetical protein [Phycisphaerae bacterium]
MTQLLPITTTELAQCLRKAASTRVPVTVHCRSVGGANVHRTRILAADPQRNQLVIEYPTPAVPGQPHAEIVAGQCLGLSFHHASRKCVFDTETIGRCRFTLRSGQDLPALTLQWPESAHQFQRRLYIRTPVPRHVVVPVDLWRPDPLPEDSPPSIPCRGLMLDLSAGGLSVAVPANRGVGRWRSGDSVTCAFRLQPDHPAQQLAGRVTHCERLDDGHTRLGLQFVGLESGPDGPLIVDHIRQLTCRLRRMEPRGRL